MELRLSCINPMECVDIMPMWVCMKHFEICLAPQTIRTRFIYEVLMGIRGCPWEMRQSVFDIIFKPTIQNSSLDTQCEIALEWMTKNFTNEKSLLLHVEALCQQETNHYLSQCCHRLMASYGVIRSRWVNITVQGFVFWYICRSFRSTFPGKGLYESVIWCSEAPYFILMFVLDILKHTYVGNYCKCPILLSELSVQCFVKATVNNQLHCHALFTNKLLCITIVCGQSFQLLIYTLLYILKQHIGQSNSILHVQLHYQIQDMIWFVTWYMLCYDVTWCLIIPHHIILYTIWYCTYEDAIHN